MSAAQERGGEVPAAGAADEARVAVDGDGAGQTVGVEDLGQCGDGRFVSEVIPHPRRDHQRGAAVHTVECLDHMLALAGRFGRHTGNVLEVELPATEGRWPVERRVVAAGPLRDAAVAREDLPDRACGVLGR